MNGVNAERMKDTRKHPPLNEWMDDLLLFLFGFYGPSRLFHSFWAESIVRWGKKADLREKPPDHPQAELGCPVCDPS